ncbi:MAG: penicillin-binding transpeptidase domain-containing protein [Candidatus Krumholzibacteria bacterium]|nr:penicillin-binding transpeptidase domain-containing protein [Candidatus Krumholzibacteria bacterium]
MTRGTHQRRLRLLVLTAIASVCVLFGRIFQVQILQYPEHKAAAERQNQRTVAWPARRGCIYDRDGFPLAVTHKTYTLGVTPRHVPDRDETVRMIADASARRQSDLRRILRTGRDAEYIQLARRIPLTSEQKAQLAAVPGVAVDNDPERLRPFECVAPALLGAVNLEGAATGGVELAFDGYLRGADGWLLVNRDARDREFVRAGAPGRQPENGHDVYLTIDSGIQAIVDFELEQAVSRYGAASGAAVVVEPHTGDVLALAEKRAPGGAQVPAGGLFSTSCIFEPGSTFKLVTCSFLLDAGAVDPYDAFYGEQGEAKFEFGRFRDDHEFGWLTFKEMFIHSSNICMIKANLASDQDEFYAFLLRSGFGARTGIDLPAESPGTLRPPAQWSRRSMASISIGHEIGVTVMQMAMAYCAVANGGWLMVPRIATAVRDERGKIVQEWLPVRVRRIMSEQTARTMRDFCRQVVAAGTGVKAAVKELDVAGKTGTAQVSDGSGYVRGRCIASFAGFVPADDPRLVCLVILDDPQAPNNYGGQSSAVAFSEIVEGINLSSDILGTADSRTTIVESSRDGMIEVPSFFRLSCDEAVSLAAQSGLRTFFSSGEGVVYAQIPGPGSLVREGAEIILSFLDERGRGGEVGVPELRGMSMRGARRMLLECGLRSRIEGTGVVHLQDPLPGASVDRGSIVSIRCKPGPPAQDGPAGGGAEGRASG